MASFTPCLETPLLKVSRPVAACSRCRTAKIKCDGKLPACSACERAGKSSTCPGATDEFAKGKERSYVASLEGQCERLEKEIAEAKRRRQNSRMEGTPIGQRDSMRLMISQGGERARRKETSDIDDLVGDFGFLYVHQVAYPPITSLKILTLILDQSTRHRGIFMASHPRHLLPGFF